MATHLFSSLFCQKPKFTLLIQTNKQLQLLRKFISTLDCKIWLLATLELSRLRRPLSRNMDLLTWYSLITGKIFTFQIWSGSKRRELFKRALSLLQTTFSNREFLTIINTSRKVRIILAYSTTRILLAPMNLMLSSYLKGFNDSFSQTSLFLYKKKSSIKHHFFIALILLLMRSLINSGCSIMIQWSLSTLCSSHFSCSKR